MSVLTADDRQLALSAAIEGGLRMLFQPIVELEGRRAVGFEALARGPVGSALERPDDLFAEARRRGLLSDLDWACRSAAVLQARAAGLRRPLALFVNVEPDAIVRRPADAGLVDTWESTRSEFSIVLEVTERALLDRPAELLRDLELARESGCRIAVDDVGADPRSLALMPFLYPDVIKLDLRLVQQHPGREVARIVNAVRAEAERSGAQILAEGVESERHLEMAYALGATLGQGYLFGRPGPLDPTRPAALLQSHRPPRLNVPNTPFELIGANIRSRISRKPLLIAISKQLEAEAAEIGETATVTAAFQEARFFTERTRRRYVELAGTTAFVAALGQGMTSEPAAGVRGIDLAAGDPLRGEWTIAVVAPHFAACLSARDLGDRGPELERRFEYSLTFDRQLAIAAADSLLQRVTTAEAPAD